MRKITSIFCTVAMALCLTACGGSKDKNVTVDTAKLAEELSGTVTSGTLSKAALDVSQLYILAEDAVETGVAYTNDGSTSCEVAVIQSKEASKTSDVEKQLKAHVDSQTQLYSSYAPEEADKLKDAIVKSTGAYTVLCVTDDTSKANDILKNYGF